MIQLSGILKIKKAAELLEFFLNNPDTEFYQTEIAKQLKISRTTLLKWINLLVENGLLEMKIRGKEKYYRLNKENPVVKQIKVLATVSKLHESIKILKGENVEVYLYGSCARGEDVEESDVDILIVGKLEKRKLVELVESMKKSTGREVKPVVFNPLEYSNLARKDRVFYENIERNKIRLL